MEYDVIMMTNIKTAGSTKEKEKKKELRIKGEHAGIWQGVSAVTELLFEFLSSNWFKVVYGLFVVTRFFYELLFTFLLFLI